MKTLFTALAVAALAALSIPLATPAAAADEGAVTWSVRPGDEDGTDDRAWVEWEADPGESMTDHLVVANYGDAEVEFALAAADGYFTDTGRFNMLASDQESSDGGTWIDLPESVTVAAGSSQVVPFTVTVPEDATPGDHPAGVAASVTTTQDGSVGVESRVGFRVMTRVAGELAPALGISVDGAYTGEVNPFEAGSVEVGYEVANMGNVRVSAQPEIVVSGPFGLGEQRIAGEEIVELAPGETRSGRVRISDAWPLFSYDARVSAAPTPVSEELAFDDAAPSNGEAAVLAMPWSQLVVLAIAVLLLLLSIRRRRRDRIRTERLVARAREEALAEAGAADTVAAPTVTRSARRPRAAAGIVTLALFALPASAAHAQDEESSSGVEVSVEIPARSTPLPDAPEEDTPADLLPTGSAPAHGILFASASLAALGAAAVIVSRRRLS